MSLRLSDGCFTSNQPDFYGTLCLVRHHLSQIIAYPMAVVQHFWETLHPSEFAVIPLFGGIANQNNITVSGPAWFSYQGGVSSHWCPTGVLESNYNYPHCTTHCDRKPTFPHVGISLLSRERHIIVKQRAEWLVSKTQPFYCPGLQKWTCSFTGQWLCNSAIVYTPKP